MRKKIGAISDKISKFHDKHENILMLVMILIIIASVTFFYRFKPYDLLWNFGNMYKLFLGYKIYEEVAIITTPLVFYIGEFFFKLFGANFFVYNMLNILILFIYYICIFVVFKKLIKSKKIRDFCFIFITFITSGVYGVNGPNYTTLSTVFVILIIISNLYLQNNKKRRIINGILAALAFLTYQKAGAAAVLTIFLYETFNKETPEKRTKFLNLSISGLSMIFCVGMYILYLLSTHNLYNFFDMTIFGIKEFTNNFETGSVTIVRLIIIEAVSIIYYLIIKKFKKTNDILFLLFIANLSSIIYLYPIINTYHSYIWLIFAVLFILYATDLIFEGFELTNSKQQIIVLSATILMVLIAIIFGVWRIYYFPIYKTNYEDMYFGSSITTEQVKRIEEVNEYIDNAKTKYDNVIVFSVCAMLYKNTYIQNNRFFDLPNRGNFGKKGEQGLIDEITKMENTLILVQKEDSEYEIFQFPKNVRQYIMEHYDNVETLQHYDVYEINNKQKEY